MPSTSPQPPHSAGPAFQPAPRPLWLMLRESQSGDLKLCWGTERAEKAEQAIVLENVYAATVATNPTFTGNEQTDTTFCTIRSAQAFLCLCSAMNTTADITDCHRVGPMDTYRFSPDTASGPLVYEMRALICTLGSSPISTKRTQQGLGGSDAELMHGFSRTKGGSSRCR
ncbi:unnamed protein product [Boreogadus saida]